MRQLNVRLAEFMSHCFRLEESNLLLEKTIEEQLENSASEVSNWKDKVQESKSLVHSICDAVMENAHLYLGVDRCSADLASLRERYSKELSAGEQVSGKNALLETMRAEFAQSIAELELAVRSMEEEADDLTTNRQRVQYGHASPEAPATGGREQRVACTVG
ncbi:keratin, type I cytoskeletal 10-like [Ascaphus truei]|uniref:keratin, type I cytoskeletal 10-like n=1 Tax=Ascaphus truei TaxID=8439 RepID=UPI003F5A1DB2